MKFDLIKKFNTLLSILIIATFLIEFGLICFADFSGNRGTTKGVALLFFSLTYFWFALPAITSLLLRNITRFKIMLIVFTILNLTIFICGIPMLFAYLQSNQ
jgi:hypothetical protein